MIDFSLDIERSLEVLHQGGILLYPTDTIWGIGCDATNPKAVEKIISLKQRPTKMNFVVLTASEKEVLQYVASLDLGVFDYLNATKVPTTVVYEHAIGLAENVISEDGSIAIRICSNEFCKHLIKRFRKPIVSTSANINGHPTSGFFKEITQEIKSGVDYIVQYRQNEETKAAASAIIRWNNNGTPTMIRPYLPLSY